MAVRRLSAAALVGKIDPKSLTFKTTDDLEPIQGLIAQDRATNAIDFGLAIEKRGYNVYVSGSWGTGRTSYVMQITEKQARQHAVPDDWLYVYNFETNRCPQALALKAGQGKKFVKDFGQAIESIRLNINEQFNSKTYEADKNKVVKKYQTNTERIIETLNEYGEKYDFRFTQNEKGIVSIPLKNGEAMSEEDYHNLSDEEFEALRKRSEELSEKTAQLFQQLREEERLYREKMAKLDDRLIGLVVEHNLAPLIEHHQDNQAVSDYLKAVKADIMAHSDQFKAGESKGDNNPFAMFARKNPEAFFERYRVNLFVDHSDKKYAPIVFESNPSYSNLIGAIEYRNEFGAMKTDFMQIKPGALHLANGGYLILHAKDLLTNYYSWRGLKRAMLDQRIAIEGMGNQYSHAVVATLKPEPIPLDVKVIIIGDAYTHYLLYQHDEEFRKLFKIEADFDVVMDKDHDNIIKLARFIAKHCQKQKLRPFDRSAVAKVIEYAMRLADDQEKMSAHLNSIVDILIEADAWAAMKGDDLVSETHIKTALDKKRLRNNQYEEKVMELFENGTYLIDVTGQKVGEINGLAVVGGVDYSFGKPSKITVSTFKGQEGIVNIEREAKTSGKIHDKGVLIISGYLGYKYAQDNPLSLTATVVFEQLYSGVDGDSASSTELYAILSSLADLPIKQNLAVTGSVNQRGYIQPIGGVNQKIEGFYNVCRLKGLSGDQGVLIPHQNVKNLMLSDEVVEAVKAGMFHIYPIETIDQGIELLMDHKAGKANKTGGFTKGSVHDLVYKKILKLAEPIDEK